jgi:DNA-binding beta-propeller fold protein YncE
VRQSIAFFLLTVTLISGQRLARTIAYQDTWATTPNPSFLAYDSSGRRVYIGGASGVVAVDAATRERVASYRLPGWTEPCPAAGRNVLYCLTHGANRVYQVDCATGRIVDSLQLPGEFSPWCYNSKQDRLYVFLPECGFGLTIDCATNRVIDTLSSPIAPRAAMYYPARNKLYYTSRNGTASSLTIVDCETDSVLARHVFAGDTCLTGLCYNASTDRVYCCSRSGTLFVVDGSSNAISRRVELSSEAYLFGVCYNPASNRLFCAGDMGVMYILDAATEQVVGEAEITETGEPVLLVSPRSNKVYLADADNCWCMEREVDVLDGTDGTMLARFPHLYIPNAMCWDPLTDVVYFTNSHYDEVLVLDCCGDTLVDALPTLSSPRSLCWNPGERLLFVADASHRMAIIDPDRGVCAGSVKLPAQPGTIICDSDLNRLVVRADEHLAPDSFGLFILDGKSGGLLQSVAIATERAYLAPNVHKVYCAETDSLTVIDLRTGTIKRSIHLPGFDRYEPLVFAARLGRVYTRVRDSLTVINTEKDSVVEKWSPADAVLGENSHLELLYVLQDETLKAIDEQTGDVVASVPSPIRGSCFAVNEPAQRLYCAAKDSWRLLTLDARTLTPLDTAVLERPLRWIGYSPSANRVYCMDDSGAVLFFDGASGERVDVPGCAKATCAPVMDLSTGSLYVAGYPGLLSVIEDSIRLGESPARQPFLGRESLEVYVPGSLYDVSGRKVAVLEPGTMSLRGLRSGIYIVLRPGVTKPRKLVVLR